jgi:ectoine hydroxylase
MRLTDAQVEEYRDRGFVLVPGLLNEQELRVLDAAVAKVIEQDGPQLSREKDGSPHVVYGMHMLDPRFRALSRHPEIVAQASQLLGGAFFVHQSRVNVKQYGGAIVDWHQDYGTYHRVDGVPRPDGIMISVFLDDVSACNAPLMVVPGSHREGLVSEARVNPEAEDHASAARYRFDISRATMERLVKTYGLEVITGPKGSVLYLNMQVVHGSTVNITPLRRVILYLNVCRTDNRGETFARPEYLAARDFAAIEPADADCLVALADFH